MVSPPPVFASIVFASIVFASIVFASIVFASIVFASISVGFGDRAPEVVRAASAGISDGGRG